jgi:hypothetical protein
MDNSKCLVSRKLPNDKYNVEAQIHRLAYLFKRLGIKEIVLADDVVFSGSVLKKIIKEFKDCNINVIGIRSCISSYESFTYFNKTLPLGLKCGYLMSGQVIDQICERDFYFGIAGSGISIIKNNEVLKAPYFKPYGDPVNRSSIPTIEEQKFSLTCLRRSLELWQEIERLNRREIKIKELPEKIVDTNENDSVVKTLKKGMNKLCIK